MDIRILLKKLRERLADLHFPARGFAASKVMVLPTSGTTYAAAKLALVLCALVAMIPRSADAADSHKPPGVFLITLDTLRADHVHCYGNSSIRTPALDGLANDGIRFSQAFTPSPITTSSHTTILTGLLPRHHGVTDFAVPLAAEHATWAELLKDRRYHTAAFIGAVVLDSQSLAPGLDHGFDHYDNFPRPSTKSRWGRLERRGMEVVQHAESWLDAHPAGPHFVWVHLYDPHDPYEPPPPFAQQHRGNPYDGEIAYADSAVGNFVAYLKHRGWYRESLIVVVGDHGEGLGDHGEDTHGIFLYDSTTHVPLIVKLPGQAHRGTAVDAQVRTTDILPTVLDVLGISTPPRLDGESLRPYFEGAETTDRPVFGETRYPARFGWAPLQSVRAGGFKFIDAPRPEFYDLRTDPQELKNIYEPWNKTVQEFRAMLADFGAQSPGPSLEESPVGTEKLEELRSLGYLHSPDSAKTSSAAEPRLLPDPKDKIGEHNLLHKALMAEESGRIAEARGELESVLATDPQSPAALRQLGELELHAQRYTQAADYLKRARAQWPDDFELAFNEGRVLQKIGDLAGARDALEASLKLVPPQFPARMLLGEVYLELNQAALAKDQFEQALALRPKDPAAQLGLTKAQAKLKRQPLKP